MNFSEVVKLPAGELIITLSTEITDAASGHFVAKFTYQVNGAGDILPITEQSWWHDTTSKHLEFMVNTGGKLPKINYFRDFRSPDEEETTVDIKPEVTE